MKLIDLDYTIHPAKGVFGMTDHLQEYGDGDRIDGVNN